MIKYAERNKVRPWDWNTIAWIFIAIFFVLFGPAKTSAADLSKDQEGLVEKLGHPKSFTIAIDKDEINHPGKVIRYESWDYYQSKSSFAFIDGNFEGTYDIEDVPDGTILPIQYRPEQFDNEMSLEDVKKRIIGETSYGKLDVPIDLLQDAQLIDSEQIILVFQEGKLVYAETIPLIPQQGEEE